MLAGRQQEIHAERDRKLETGQTAAAESSPACDLRSKGVHLRKLATDPGTSWPDLAETRLPDCR